MKLSSVMFINKNGELKPRKPWPCKLKNTLGNRFMIQAYAEQELGRLLTVPELQEWINLTMEPIEEK